jgi:peptidyl-prolyl cis-trans isomerase B (cyclophilin B)
MFSEFDLMTRLTQRFMKVALSFTAVMLLFTSATFASSGSLSRTNSQAGSLISQAQEPAKSTPVAANTESQPPQLIGKATVVMRVNGKPITVELDGANAPVTAGNFIDLAQRGVYDGTRFHRVITAPQPFVAQGGDPTSKDPNVPTTSLGSGNFIDPQTKQDRYIPLEIMPSGGKAPIYSQTFKTAKISVPPQLPHKKGAIAMARTPIPDSASAQFYFALSDLEFLDGDYAVFGYVTDGMDVVEGIRQGDVIESVKVTKGAEQLKK